jgi:hypothetical protein
MVWLTLLLGFIIIGISVYLFKKDKGSSSSNNSNSDEEFWTNGNSQHVWRTENLIGNGAHSDSASFLVETLFLIGATVVIASILTILMT